MMAAAERAPAKNSEEQEGLASLALAAAMAEDSRQATKVAWIVALLFHLALFLVVFPEFGVGERFEERRDAVVIRTYKPPEPPKQQPEKKIVKKKVARVPIPDPTPNDPEPLFDENVEYVEIDAEQADTEFLAGGPIGGPPAIDSGPMRVGGAIQEPERVVYVRPEYPELARRARQSGEVTLEATIDREGKVTNVVVLRGLGLGLSEAAVRAVSQWQYTPTLYNGRPVEVLLTVTVKFQMGS